MNYSEALKLFGFTGEFTEENLRKKYLELSKKYHPDMGGSDEMMKAVNTAYDTLKGKPINCDSSYYNTLKEELQIYVSKKVYEPGSAEEYDDMISKLEWQVIGTIPASEGFVIPSDKVSMYDYSLQDLEKMYQNPASARIIHEEIELCRELKKFKPENKGAVLEKKVN